MKKKGIVLVLLGSVFLLSSCGSSASTDNATAVPTISQSPIPFEDSLDDINFTDGSADLNKIARSLEEHATSTDGIPNYASQVDSIHWEDIDKALDEIQKQL